MERMRALGARDFDRRLPPVIGSPRSDIFDTVAGAASEGKFSIRVGDTVPFGEAIRLLTELEAGRTSHHPPGRGDASCVLTS